MTRLILFLRSIILEFVKFVHLRVALFYYVYTGANQHDGISVAQINEILLSEPPGF